MPDLSIGQVARRAGISASAIRYWERRRLIAAPPRRAGRRCYDPAIVVRLRQVAAARRAGLAIAEIRRLLDAARTRPGLDAALAAATARVDARLAALERLRAGLAALAACGCAEPLACPRAAAIEPDRP
jgi:MerR family transcriptional regulator, redox-sensitive transcriptional activator SoxR